MSDRPSPARSRQLFFIWAPDKADEGTFERRLSVRNDHLESAKAHVSDGFIRAYYGRRVQMDGLMLFLE
jgi:hypothetical protein